MRKATMAFAAVLLAVGCVKQEVVQTPSAGVGPTLLVEQFLHAANAGQWSALGNMFGTKNGPISSRDNKDDVEKRMALIGNELKSEDYSIVSEEAVPGRADATKLIVNLKKEGKNVRVPFTLVRYKDKRWLVEEIGLQAITAPRN